MTGGGELERFGMGRVVGECRAGDGRGPGHGQKLLSGYARAVHEKRARGQWTLDVSPKTHFPVRIYGFTRRLRPTWATATGLSGPGRVPGSCVSSSSLPC